MNTGASTGPALVVIVVAWLLALAGLALAFIVSLAAAMKTVPSMSLGEAAVGVPLPLLGGIVAGLGLRASLRGGRTGRAIAFGLALVVALLGLLVAIVGYVGQPGGPH